MTSCYYGNSRLVDILITSNANMELEDISGNLAWQLAIENGNTECVQLILNEMGLFLSKLHILGKKRI